MHSSDEALTTCTLNAVVCKGHRQGGSHLKLVQHCHSLREGPLNYISPAQTCMFSRGLHERGVQTMSGGCFYLLQHVHITCMYVCYLHV